MVLDQTMKILNDIDVAVIDGDTHISTWVQQHGKLNIAESMLSPLLQYITEGGVVVDCGAMIGDHTITYARAVGESGCVYAFEPNEQAFECLEYNTKYMKNVLCFCCAIGKAGKAILHKDVNAGASHLQYSESGIDVVTLDSLNFSKLDFIKIDVEGFECDVVEGAAETLRRCRPVILCEFNHGALIRNGKSSEELKSLFARQGYSTVMIDPRLRWSDPQFDALCLPN